MSLSRRELCLVRRREGVLTCRYLGGAVLPLSMGSAERLEAESATFFRAYRPRDGDVVVDAGAGAGIDALVLARLVGSRGRVVAIEAHPGSFAQLELLLRVNQLKNVDCVHVALLDAPGTVVISDEKRPIENSVVSGDGTIPVAADTLDRVLARLGVERVDFLKMNIEGAELKALGGFSAGLASTVHVAVGCHDFVADRDPSREMFRTKGAVRSLLETAGFEVGDGPADGTPWDRDYLYAERRGAVPCPE
jgi:FkbM family methyltransferase